MSKIYLQCDLPMRSEIDLPLAELPPESPFAVDTVWGEDRTTSCDPVPGQLIAEYDDGDIVWYQGARTDDGYVMRFQSCCEFRISADLDRIVVHPDPGPYTNMIPILLAGTVTAFVLGLRGDAVFHASAVKVDDKALAFVGHSGQGKSTMAALMCAAGAPIVTDDVLMVRAGDPVVCAGGAVELRLREQSRGIAGTDDMAETSETADERLAYKPAEAVTDTLPLGAIIIPNPDRDVDAVSLERYDPTRSLLEILGFPRVQAWSDPDVLRRDFETISQVVNRVPVFEATIPWGPPFDPTIPEQLLAALAAEHVSAH